MKFCQICKSNDHNTDHCLSKIISGSCPSREIVPVHVVQLQVLVIQDQKQFQNYNVPNNQNQYNDQQYNARPNGQNWHNNNQPNRIIDILNEAIIRTLDFGRMVYGVFIVGRKGMPGMIIMLGRKLWRKKRRIPNRRSNLMW
jgi:hypothetical protein